MPYQLVFTDDYIRRALRFLKRHPELKAQYGKTLALLEINPHHPSLRLLAREGRLQGCIRRRSACRTASRWSC